MGRSWNYQSAVVAIVFEKLDHSLWTLLAHLGHPGCFLERKRSSYRGSVAAQYLMLQGSAWTFDFEKYCGSSWSGVDVGLIYCPLFSRSGSGNECWPWDCSCISCGVEPEEQDVH
jgi:hypothetical protein